MFIPALRNLGTEEQQARWVPRAINCSIIGAYAQTELGHGTFIRGLETTSTFDPKTKEFVIHSPTITAYKVSDMTDDNSDVFIHGCLYPIVVARRPWKYC
jgi:alkylation response protein AidB-like acyl-CoA dehydrogenase